MQDKEISALQKENSVQRSEVEALIQELDAQRNGSIDDAGWREKVDEQEKEIGQL